MCDIPFGHGMVPMIFWGPIGPGVWRKRKGCSVSSYVRALHYATRPFSKKTLNLMGDWCSEDESSNWHPNPKKLRQR